jgi:hypothetical protein
VFSLIGIVAVALTMTACNNGDTDPAIADNQAITTAKALVEGATYTGTQANITTEAEAKTRVESIIDGLTLDGITPEVVTGSFTAAIAGTFEKVSGENGIYEFIVKLNKGIGAEQITGTLTLTINATVYAHTHVMGSVVSRVEATCTLAGNIEHWICTICDKFFADEDGDEELEEEEIVIAKNPANHTGTQVVRTAATCTTKGINEWNCCEADGDPINEDPANHAGTQVVRTQATCTTAGINEWNCCKADGSTINRDPNAHDFPLTHKPAVAATCTTAGNIEHWTCEDCKKHFANDNGTGDLTPAQIIDDIDPANHTGTQVVRTPATCTTAGINEWNCCKADGSTIDINPTNHTGE